MSKFLVDFFAISFALGLVPTAFGQNLGQQVYFQRCTGCHGTLRQGATGPALTPQSLKGLPSWKVKTNIENGTSGGMPPFSDSLSFEEIHAVMEYVKNTEVAAPPPWGQPEILGSHKIHIPMGLRPAQKENSYDLDDLFAVTLRDAGQIALVDGPTKKIATILPTGYAVHISRYSNDGHYLYTIGRDGKITQVDLWMKTPQVVGEVRVALEARSVEVAKVGGRNLLIGGGYYPSHVVLMDADTLEPLSVQSVPLLAGLTPAEPGKETRVGAIVASHLFPEFILNLKEAGKILFLDYQSLVFKSTGVAEGSGLLHDGGMDSTKRFFLSAVPDPEGGKIAVIDVSTKKQIALVSVGKLPHPGRGANFVDPQFGRVWAAGHLGSREVSLISTDPLRPDAWTVVRKLEAAGTGSLFLKAHPKGKHLWIDSALSPDGILKQTLFGYEIQQIHMLPKKISLANFGLSEKFPNAKLVHPEFNKDGSELWISIWSPKGEPSGLLVLDEATGNLKQLIEGPEIKTPTGKFNSLNTRLDVY